MSNEEFEELYNKYYKDVFYFAKYQTGQPQSAEDITQDAFLKILRNKKIKASDKCKNLLFKIVREDCISIRRRNVVAEKFIQEEIRVTESDRSPEEISMYREFAENYERSLIEMTRKQRDAYILSREKGMTYAQISDELGVSVKSVEKRISGALSVIRSYLLK